MAPPQLRCLLQVSQCPLLYSLIRQAERQELYVPMPALHRGQLPWRDLSRQHTWMDGVERLSQLRTGRRATSFSGGWVMFKLNLKT